MNSKFCPANLSNHLGSKFHLSEAKQAMISLQGTAELYVYMNVVIKVGIDNQWLDHRAKEKNTFENLLTLS